MMDPRTKLLSETYRLFNPYHGKAGKFTSKERAVTVSGAVSSVQKELKKQGLTAARLGGFKGGLKGSVKANEIISKHTDALRKTAKKTGRTKTASELTKAYNASDKTGKRVTKIIAQGLWLDAYDVKKGKWDARRYKRLLSLPDDYPDEKLPPHIPLGKAKKQ